LTVQEKNPLPPWLKPKALPPRLALGVGWYTAENWLKVKQSCVDPDRFEASYAEWLEMAEAALSDMRAAGLAAEKSYVEADALLAWCLAHDKINNSASRAEFVAHQGIRPPDDDGV
jgi:hypothetical protein